MTPEQITGLVVFAAALTAASAAMLVIVVLAIAALEVRR